MRILAIGDIVGSVTVDYLEKRFGGSGEELKPIIQQLQSPATTSRTGSPLTCLHMAHWYLHSEKCVVRVF